MANDDKAALILHHAARLFSKRSYAATSIRDIARDAQISLAGLYYYFKSKDEVLFIIQKSSFEYLIHSFQKKAEGITDPTEKLNVLVSNHIAYFVNNMDQMKVLSHESETLDNDYYDQIAAMKREYFKILITVIEEIIPHATANDHARTAAMSLFGMMNWIYNWYDPQHDLPADQLADQMTTLFLHGLLATTEG